MRHLTHFINGYLFFCQSKTTKHHLTPCTSCLVFCIYFNTRRAHENKLVRKHKNSLSKVDYANGEAITTSQIENNTLIVHHSARFHLDSGASLLYIFGNFHMNPFSYIMLITQQFSHGIPDLGPPRLNMHTRQSKVY
jgi:hypothetical protein